MQRISIATDWNKHFDDDLPMVYLFADPDSEEFLAFVYTSDRDCRAYEGNFTLMQRHREWDILGEPLSDPGTDVGLTIQDADSGDNLYELEIREKDPVLAVEGWRITWLHLDPHSHIIERSDDGETLRVSRPKQ